jgi:menaquinone-dependent protoporphyrinogen oxidase
LAESSQKSILLLHNGRFGQSRKIASVVTGELLEAGIPAEAVELTNATRIDPAAHAGIGFVISVRYGHFARAAYRLIAAHQAWIASVPSLLITVSLTARKPEKRDPATHPYTRKFLRKTGWTPTRVAVVAGAVQYPRYNIFDKTCIRLIMLLTGGETDGTSEIDYTDWNQVRMAAQGYTRSVRARSGNLS